MDYCLGRSQRMDDGPLPHSGTSWAQADWQTRAPVNLLEPCNAFVRHCDEAIRRVGAIHAMPPGDLDDFAQDAWLAVLKALQSGGYDPRLGRWQDWLFVVARNRAMTFARHRWRAERRVVQVPLELLESRWSDDPSWLLDRRCNVEAVRGALDVLQQRTSPLTYAVFYLRQMKQLGVEEVAEALKLTREQVRVYDHRARRKLEAILIRQGFDRRGLSIDLHRPV